MKYAILSIVTALVVSGAFIGGVMFGRKIEREAAMGPSVYSYDVSYSKPEQSIAPYSYSYTPDYSSGATYTPSK